MSEISQDIPAEAVDVNLGEEDKPTQNSLKIKRDQDKCDSSVTTTDPLVDEDQDLRSTLEKAAFRVLSEEVIVKKPRLEEQQTQNDVEVADQVDVFTLLFPKKMWYIVENPEFKSIGWDETGIYVVIDEDLFVKEVLERKEPPRLFHTKNIHSFFRQLNMYGFRKAGSLWEGAASLTCFMSEPKCVTKVRNWLDSPIWLKCYECNITVF